MARAHTALPSTYRDFPCLGTEYGKRKADGGKKKKKRLSSVPHYRATATTTRQTSTIPSSPNVLIDFAQPLPSQHQLSTAFGTQILPASSRLPIPKAPAFFSLYRPLGTFHRPKNTVFSCATINKPYKSLPLIFCIFIHLFSSDTFHFTDAHQTHFPHPIPTPWLASRSPSTP